MRYCQEERLTFTRSRPYRKNDTCYVEQKNWSIVRRYEEAKTPYRRLQARYDALRLPDLYRDIRRLQSSWSGWAPRTPKPTRDTAP